MNRRLKEILIFSSGRDETSEVTLEMRTMGVSDGERWSLTLLDVSSSLRAVASSGVNGAVVMS